MSTDWWSPYLPVLAAFIGGIGVLLAAMMTARATARRERDAWERQREDQRARDRADREREDRHRFADQKRLAYLGFMTRLRRFDRAVDAARSRPGPMPPDGDELRRLLSDLGDAATELQMLAPDDISELLNTIINNAYKQHALLAAGDQHQLAALMETIVVDLTRFRVHVRQDLSIQPSL